MFIDNNYLYLADSDACLRIVDISNPENPLIINSINFTSAYTPPCNAQDVYIYENQAFLAAYEGGLLVLDVSDPMEVEKIKEVIYIPGSDGTYLQGYFRDVYANDNFIFAAGDNGLLIINQSDGKVISNLSIKNADNVRVYDNFVYLSSFDNFISRFVVVNNITDPQIVGSLDLELGSWTINDIEIYGNKVYMAVGSSLLVADISDPYNPKIVGKVLDPDYKNILQNIYIDSNYIYVVGSKYLRILKPVKF